MLSTMAPPTSGRMLQAAFPTSFVCQLCLSEVSKTSAERTQLMLENVSSHASSLAGSSFLVETVVNAAIDSSVVDVVGDLFPTGVMKRHVWHEWVGEGDGVPARTVDLFEDAASGGAKGCVAGRIARERRRRKEGLPVPIWIGLGVIVRCPGSDRRDRSPEIVEVLGVKTRDCAIRDCDRHQG